MSDTPGPSGDPARLAKRSVLVAGHHTSLTLEDLFWNALRNIARERGLSINALVTEIDAGRTGNLSSAVRVFVLQQVSATRD
ncbi:MAG: aryl-sulfate sulfotransferase [Rhodospirillales bacterium CG15_BIG_FIL_POST_REV_8_21_14_020_66_15]|nr:MAG: aryl-sulfate sulfotransferase [Rhodospirillales bacterium CG15_BIG_FIL_POST_REV_8_21_14_020_66_15]